MWGWGPGWPGPIDKSERLGAGLARAWPARPRKTTDRHIPNMVWHGTSLSLATILDPCLNFFDDLVILEIVSQTCFLGFHPGHVSTVDTCDETGHMSALWTSQRFLLLR